MYISTSSVYNSTFGFIPSHPLHTPHISLVKIFRCGGSDDSIRLRCSDNSDNLTIVIESKGILMNSYHMP